MQGIGKYCMILTLLSGEHLAGRPQSSRFLSSLLLVIVVVVVNRWKWYGSRTAPPGRIRFTITTAKKNPENGIHSLTRYLFPKWVIQPSVAAPSATKVYVDRFFSSTSSAAVDSLQPTEEAKDINIHVESWQRVIVKVIMGPHTTLV